MLKTLMKMCFVASAVLVIGCSSGTVSSGLSESPVYSQEEADDIFNNAPEEIVLKEKDRLEQQSNRMSQLKEILKSIS